MNPPQPYLDTGAGAHPHMSTGASYAALNQPTTGGMSHYSSYGQSPQTHLPSASGGPYAPTGGSYGGYYSGGITSPQSAGSNSGVSMGQPSLPSLSMAPTQHPQHQYGTPGSQGGGYPPHPYDTTGQSAPPGVHPRVTATLWEDEGSLCFQVEAKGVCVARREDNHFINGTKLLNVAGMTRGRRDGILKSEKAKHVVKIGPMHLKGVWIPYERALDFANREKITELLYPLFVHNIGALLYHPSNTTNRPTVPMDANRRRGLTDPKQPAAMTNPGAQSAGMHHHHSISGQLPSQVGQSPHSLAPHPGASRPGLDRAHTFPTPPTSASSVLTAQGSTYDWNQPPLGSAVAGAPQQPLAIDTGLSNARSLPATPAGTPPGGAGGANSAPGLHSLPPSYAGQQSAPAPSSYDSARGLYSAAPQPASQYAAQQHNLARFGTPMQPHPFMKSDMGPPPSSRGGLASAGAVDPAADHPQHHHPHHADIKPDPYAAAGAGAGDDAEHDGADYAHDGGAAGYDGGRVAYSTYPTSGVAALHGDAGHHHLSESVHGSPHQNGNGRVTPRASVGGGPWASGYHTPPRSDTYPAASYAPSAVNGVGASAKRGREDDDGAADYKRGPGDDLDAIKRLKSSHDVAGGGGGGGGGATFDAQGRPLNRSQSTIIQHSIATH